MRISDWSSDVCSSDRIVAAAAGIGVIVGLLAALLSSLLYRVEDLFHRLPVLWKWWTAIGAVVVGVGGLIDARVLGDGHSNIQTLVGASQRLRAATILQAVKAVRQAERRVVEKGDS